MGFDFGEKANAQAGEEVERRCVACRKTMQVPAWYAKVVELHFCGDACRSEWVAQQPDFQPQLGQHSRWHGANWDLQAKKARERDGFACQLCGIAEEKLGRQLDVHHKIPYRSFKSNVEANKLENLVSVCASCHAKLEAQLRRELPLFGK
jgi:5-methylcytosine-specific restriction endonuclease McrA